MNIFRKKRQRMANNVYTYNFGLPVPAAGNATEIFRLIDNQRQLNIKSILLQAKLTKVIAGAFVFYNDYNLPTDFHYRITVGNGAILSNKIGKALNHIFGNGLLANSGDYFTIEQSGIYHFSSFFVSEQIDFQVSADNVDPVNSATLWLSFVIETDSTINF